jgi:hypothetical protein
MSKDKYRTPGGVDGGWTSEHATLNVERREGEGWEVGRFKKGGVEQEMRKRWNVER